MICSFCGNVTENRRAVSLYMRAARITYIDCPECGCALSMGEIRAAVRNYNEQFEEKRYNHNHDSKGRFCSGSGSGETGGFIGSDEVFSVGSIKNIVNGLVNYVKSAIMDTGEHAMYPDSIAGAERGEPMTFDEADNGRANPHYSSYFAAIGDEFSRNCQSCVVAHEARIRGYDVQAKGFDPDNVLMLNLAHISEKAWIDPKTGKTPKMTEYKGSSDKFGNWLDKTVRQGERYSVEYTHTDGRRHIITASRDNRGVIRLYDPQRNKKALGIDAINAKFGNPDSEIRNIKILRVDNLDLNLTYTDAILKK